MNAAVDRRRFDIRFIKFLFVGVLNTLFSFVIAAILVWLGVPVWLAQLIASTLGVLFNFKTTGVLVFKNKENRLIGKFFLVYAVVYAFNAGCTAALIAFVFTAGNVDAIFDFVRGLGSAGAWTSAQLAGPAVGKYLSMAIVAGPQAVASFLLMRKFVFSAKTTSATEVESESDVG